MARVTTAARYCVLCVVMDKKKAQTVTRPRLKLYL